MVEIRKCTFSYRLTATEDFNLSRLIVIASIDFVKPCLFQGRIESEAWSGLKKYYDLVDQEVQMEKDLLNKDRKDRGSASNLLENCDDLEAEIGGMGYSNGRRSKRALTRDRSVGLASQAGSERYERSNLGLLQYPELVAMAFLLTLMILTMITWAMFKMSNAIAILNERLDRIEGQLAENNQVFHVLMQQGNKESEL